MFLYSSDCEPLREDSRSAPESFHTTILSTFNCFHGAVSSPKFNSSIPSDSLAGIRLSINLALGSIVLSDDSAVSPDPKKVSPCTNIFPVAIVKSVFNTMRSRPITST